MPSALSSILSLGGLGVDVFLFLSGLGLWYSLDKFYSTEYPKLITPKSKTGGVILWYLRRYKRLLITYLLVAIPYYAVFCIVKNLSLEKYLLYVSTVGFWTEHQGIWFVDALIPIYALSPLLYCAINRSRHNAILAVSLIILCYVFCLIPNECVDSKISLLVNSQFVVVRLPSFITGMWIAKYVKNGLALRTTTIVIMVIAFISLIIVFKVLHIPLATSFFATIPLVSLMLLLCNCLRSGRVHNALMFMGNISLESYIFNVTLHFFIPYISWDIADYNISYGNYIPYLSILIVGTALSYVLNRFVKMIV